MTKPLHIFRAGRHTTMSGSQIAFGEADVAAMADAYDPALHEAPIVVGHPKTDAPAYGWIGSLQARDVDLFAEASQVETQFAEMVRDGRFKRISASFYPPKAATNPAPGTYYLKHVGFLGAQPPAVKGLKAAEFADDGEAVTLELDFSEAEIADVASAGFGGVRRVISGLRDWLLASQGQEVADGIVPSHELEHIRTTEEFMRNVIERDGGETAVPSFAETDLSRRLNARLDERADDAAARSGLIDRMASEAGIERSTVLQILRGEIETPPEERLRGFARALDMDLGDLTSLVELAAPSQTRRAAMAEPETDKDSEASRAEIARRERELEAREAAFAERAAQTRRADDEALVGDLVEDGRLAPGLKAPMTAFLGALDAEEEIAFAEGETAESPRAWFRRLLSEKTRRLIEFGERAAPGEPPAALDDATAVAAAARKIQDAAREAGREINFAEAARQAEAQLMETRNG